MSVQSSPCVKNTRKRHLTTPVRTEGRKRTRQTTSVAKVTLTANFHAVSIQKEPVEVEMVETDILEPQEELDTMGAFINLPLEIVHALFSFLDRESLGCLALSSSKMCSTVRSYVYTTVGMKQILPKQPISFIHGANPMDFKDVGMLFKRITVQQSLRSRLKTASFFLNKLEATHTSICEFSGTAVAYMCFGHLFSTYVSGWEEYEKARAYCLVQSTARLEERVNKVLRSPPASMPWHEKDVRLLHRLIFLSTAKTDEEYAFWLTQILKPWPITFQARLLYMLLAPEDANGFVSWTQVCGCSSLQHTSGSVDFSELARALKLMLAHRPRDWSEDDIISIINELTTTPNGWCLENVAQLLMHCGTQITKGVLGNRAISGRVEELSMLAYYLAHACVHADQDSSSSRSSPKGYVQWFVNILRYIVDLLPTPKDRKRLLSSLMNTWQDYLTALFDDSDPEDSENEYLKEEFHITLRSLTGLSSVLLNIALEHAHHD